MPQNNGTRLQNNLRRLPFACWDHPILLIKFRGMLKKHWHSMLCHNQKVFVILWLRWPYKYQRQKVVFPVLVPLERRCCWSLHLRNLSLIQRIPETSGTHSCCLRHAELPCGSWDRLSLVQLNDGIYTTNLCIHYSPSGNFCLSLARMGISVDSKSTWSMYFIYYILYILSIDFSRSWKKSCSSQHLTELRLESSTWPLLKP